MNAVGEWPGRCTFPANLLFGFLSIPTKSNPIIVKCDTQQIRIDGTATGCSWQKAIIDDMENFVSLPEPIDHLDMLKMLEKYSKDSLYAQGFHRNIRSAKAWRTKLINEALDPLSQLGVNFDDLAHLVQETLVRESRDKR